MSDSFDNYMDIFNEIDTLFQMKKFPKMKVNMRSAATNITNIMEILVRKSFLKEDRYKYDDKIVTNFTLIEEKAFPEPGKDQEIYMRLKSLVNALNFQSDQLPSSIEGMTEEYISNCRKMIDYFAFHNLNSGNTGINTRTFKDIIDRTHASGDEVFKRVISDNIKLLAESFHQIQAAMEEITKVLKELYKAQIRFEIFPELPGTQFTEELFNTNKQKYLDNLLLFISTNFPGVEYKPHWIGEAIQCCYNTDEVEVINKLQSTFLPNTDQKTGENKTRSPREKLILLIFEMVNTKSIIQEIYIDLDVNVKLMKGKTKSFSEKIMDIFRIILKIDDESNYFHIEYVNPSTKKIQKDTIKIDDFLFSLKKKISTFEDIAKPNSEANYKIKNGTNESLIKFLDTTYFNLLVTKERILSINSEIRLNATNNIKAKLRNINEDAQRLDTVLNNIGLQRRKLIMDQESIGKK